MQLIICDEKLGRYCDFADNLDDAERLLQENKYDMVIADLMIQSEPCFGFLNRVRAVQPWARLCVMSAWQGADKLIEDCGVDSFLSKPFELEMMEEILAKK